CLYLQMHSHGHPVGYDQIVRSVEVGPHGTSLPVLRRAAAQFDFPTAIVKGAPADLRDCPLPAIAHLDHPEREQGHCVLLTAYQDDRVSVIDGTTALSMDIPIDKFRRQWSGYLLIPAASTPSWLPWATSLTAGMAAVLGFWWWRLRRQVLKTAV